MDKSPKLYWRIYDGDEIKYVPATRENSLGEFPNMSYTFLEEWEKSTFVITEEFLTNGKSLNGGYSKQQRAKLGIDPPWPPSLFPIQDMVGQEIPMKDALEFLSLKDQHLQLDEILELQLKVQKTMMTQRGICYQIGIQKMHLQSSPQKADNEMLIGKKEGLILHGTSRVIPPISAHQIVQNVAQARSKQ